MQKAKIYTDQFGRIVEISFPPNRIVSLVPSQTELLYDLGLGDRVVGITKFCIHPKKWYDEKPKIGGTKNISFDKVKALNPDLIIANKEENDQSQVEQLAKEYPVWISDINDLPSALGMIRSVSEICSCQQAGNTIIEDIEVGFSRLSINLSTAIYLVWSEPLMTSGNDTFITDMMKRAGFENAVRKTRYPELTIAEIENLNADFILLSSEPYPFRSNHQKSFQSLFPDSKVVLVDGEMFSWYGSRLRYAPKFFQALANQLIDPD